MADITQDNEALGLIQSLLDQGYTLADIQPVVQDITRNPQAIGTLRKLLAKGYFIADITTGISTLQAQAASATLSGNISAGKSTPAVELD